MCFIVPLVLHLVTRFAWICRNPTLAKCEDETHIPKVGDLESSGTPRNSKLECRGQNTSHWSVFGIIEKVLKFKCPKWPRMSHLDICSPSYGQKKGRESNWQFDSRPLKSRINPIPMCVGRVQHGVEKLSRRATILLQTSSQSEVGARSYDVPKSRESKLEQFLDFTGTKSHLGVGVVEQRR